MADMLALSREYLYFPLSQINFDISDLSLNRVAFKPAGVAPEDADWIEATVVDDQHSLFDPDIGEGLALLVGPDRGDEVTTQDLGVGSYQCWVEVSTDASDERVVRIAGTLTITETGS